MRPYDLPEYDRNAVRRHIEESRHGTAQDDADSTASGLRSALLKRFFPESYRANITTRAEVLTGEMRHVAAGLELLRTSVRTAVMLIIVLIVCRLFPSAGHYMVMVHIAVCAAGFAVRTIVPGSVLLCIFLASLALLYCVLISAESEGGEFVAYGMLFMMIWFWFAAIVSVDATDSSAAGWIRHAICVSISLALAQTINCISVWPVLAYGLLAVLFAFANAVFTKTVTVCFIDWMTYRPGLPLGMLRNGIASQKETGASLLQSAFLLAAAHVSAFLLSLDLVGLLVTARLTFSDLRSFLGSIAVFVLVALAVHAGNWLFSEVVHHGRTPGIRAWKESWYVAWKALTVWTAYVPTMPSPLVFHFQQPWDSGYLRLFVLHCVLLVNGVLTISAAGVCIADYCFRDFPAQPEATYKEVNGEIGPVERKLLVRAFDVRFWAAMAVFIVVAPGALLWLCLAAVWGPMLVASHDHFELRVSAGTCPDRAAQRS